MSVSNGVFQTALITDNDVLRTPNSTTNNQILHPVIDLLRKELEGLIASDFTFDEQNVLTFSQFKRVFMALGLFPQPLSLSMVQEQFKLHARAHRTAHGVRLKHFWLLFQNIVKQANLNKKAEGCYGDDLSPAADEYDATKSKQYLLFESQNQQAHQRRITVGSFAIRSKVDSPSAIKQQWQKDHPDI